MKLCRGMVHLAALDSPNPNYPPKNGFPEFMRCRYLWEPHGKSAGHLRWLVHRQLRHPPQALFQPEPQPPHEHLRGQLLPRQLLPTHQHPDRPVAQPAILIEPITAQKKGCDLSVELNSDFRCNLSIIS